MPMPNRRYAIVGTGALGGFYGARLQRAGLEVHYLLHRDYDHVKHCGLVVDSVEGNFMLPQVQAYQDANEMPVCDVVVVALKTTQNHVLSAILPHITRPDGIVFVLQNGLGLEEAIAELVPQSTLIGGLCFLCSNKVGPGHIRHLDYGQINLGEYQAGHVPAGITEPMQQVAEDFELAGIQILLEDDLLLARWKKLVWNIPFNGLSVVLNSSTDELMAHAETRKLSEKLMLEVVAIAAQYQRVISPDFIETMLSYTEKMKPYRTSMKIDYDEHKLMEIETMFGNPLRAAQKAKVSVPKIEMLYQQLKFLERKMAKVAD
jgi:2-dehydropantoate 2-reductase